MRKKRIAPAERNDESPTERITRLNRVGTYGRLYGQFCQKQPGAVSDLRDRIVSGEYFKATDE